MIFLLLVSHPLQNGWDNHTCNMEEAVKGNAGFAPTRWSLVQRACGARERHTALHALGEIYTAYWYPLYAFARRLGWREEDARDQTQDFFVRMVEGGMLERADRERGRLRTFLLMSFRSQLSHAVEGARAAKRGGGASVVSLDLEEAEGRYRAEWADSAATPEKVFDYTWARMMIGLAVDRLAAGRDPGEFKVLMPLVMAAADGGSYPDTARLLGVSEETVRQRISRLRKRLPESLREVVRDSLAEATPEAVDDEIASLREALRKN